MREALASTCFSLLALSAVFADGGRSPAAASTTVLEQRTREDTVTSPVDVQNVRVIMPLTFPGQVRIIVEGQKVDGVLLDVKQERKGNEIIVTITQTYPRARQSRPIAFKEPLGLDGQFPSGKYTLKVNNYSTTFDM
jgi:hypothetical protein